MTQRSTQSNQKNNDKLIKKPVLSANYDVIAVITSSIVAIAMLVLLGLPDIIRAINECAP